MTKKISILALVLLAAGSAHAADLVSGKYSCTYPNFPALNGQSYVLSVKENAHSHMLTIRVTTDLASYNYQTKQMGEFKRTTLEPFYAVPFAPGQWREQSPDAGQTPLVYAPGEDGKLNVYQDGELFQACFEVE